MSRANADMEEIHKQAAMAFLVMYNVSSARLFLKLKYDDAFFIFQFSRILEIMK